MKQFRAGLYLVPELNDCLRTCRAGTGLTLAEMMGVGDHGDRRGQGICRPQLRRGCLLLRWNDRQQRDDNTQPEGHPQQKPRYTASPARGCQNPHAKMLGGN